jgi:hypothetical protein
MLTLTTLQEQLQNKLQLAILADPKRSQSFV